MFDKNRIRMRTHVSCLEVDVLAGSKNFWMITTVKDIAYPVEGGASALRSSAAINSEARRWVTVVSVRASLFT